ncbi:MAG: OmpA family protein [Planctomycetes bacterium]|nr:OmpA family protein [Planctomycetota bacterium]
MLHRLVRGSWIGSLAMCLLAVGCVPYQTYKVVKEQLDQARDMNADLTKKYNTAMLKLGKGEAPGDYQAMKAELERVRGELEKKRPSPEFTPADREKIGGGELEEGGIALGEALLFDEGSDRLKRDAFPVLDRFVSLLKTEYPDEVIVIEGHTDNQPLDKTKERWKWNMMLAQARANAVFVYFTDHGISESKMVMRAYSFNKPVDPAQANSKEGRQQNRRVVVRRAGAVF